ncbi:hypothetical protein L1987_18503 [Smallanthus sonchifolius]|uniref:Uncharacterized protein n=1 Tax=Smallanthus sonchifolius TaxID=185202 RepID=A0ACB9J0R6_9ASTR|nr:hypothetical protein L1987_18503 [Smallanthus sonchifolius]
MLLIGFLAASNLNAAERQIISSFDFTTNISCCNTDTPIKYGMWRSIIDGPYVTMMASADSGGIQDCLRAMGALEKMFAGSDEVKENRRDILKQQYENFVYKDGESLTTQYNWYTYLFRELQCAKVKLENEDILKKFIRSLPNCWTLYTVSIRVIWHA